MTIHVLSFDFDGCLFNRSYISAVIKDKTDNDVIRHNVALFEKIKTEGTSFSKTITFIGSNRQSKQTDDTNALCGNKGSCFPTIQIVSQHLNTELDTFLLADIHGELEDGESYARAMNINYRGEHADWWFDETKASILYAQMHRVATLNPTETIVFDFYDDRVAPILLSLKNFFIKNPSLIPKNVTLNLQHYEGGDTIAPPMTKICGEGMIDTNYHQTVKDMCKITIAAAWSPDRLPMIETDTICTAHHVKPELLINRKEHTFSRFYEALLTIQAKAFDFKAIADTNNVECVYSRANEAATTLYDSINNAVKEHYSLHNIDIKEFRTRCDTAIAAARPVLEQHRGWKQVLENLAFAIVSLGVGYLIAGTIKMALTGDFLLFKPKTDSANKLDALQATIHQIEPATS